jgi:hypothetical protein
MRPFSDRICRARLWLDPKAPSASFQDERVVALICAENERTHRHSCCWRRAILDRLLHRCHVLNISGHSYRLRELERAAASSGARG